MPKLENKHKFVSFTDRISKISVDVIRRRKSDSGIVPDFEETFFAEALQRWTDMDSSQDFENFRNDIPCGQLQSYAQLIHYQKEILDALICHLGKEENYCFPTLLDLTVALARDLQSDFYSHFWSIFRCIWKIIENSGENAELLEQSFTTLAHLFKFLWRKIVKEMKKSFKKFSVLLCHRTEYIRRFASEAFAFLVRKCEKPGKFIRFSFELARKWETGFWTEGLAELYFQSMKGVQDKFHSTAPSLLRLVMKTALDLKDTEFGMDVLLDLTEKLVNHGGRNTDSTPVFDVYLACLSEAVKCRNYSRINAILEWIKIWTDAKKQSILTNLEWTGKDLEQSVAFRTIDLLELALVDDEFKDRTCVEKCVKLATDILKIGKSPLGPQVIRLGRLAKICIESGSTEKFPMDLIGKFVADSVDLAAFDQCLLVPLGTRAEKVAKIGNLADKMNMLVIYNRILDARQPAPDFGDRLVAVGSAGQFKIWRGDTADCEFINFVKKCTKSKDWSLCSAAIRLFPHLPLAATQDFEAIVEDVMTRFMERMEGAVDLDLEKFACVVWICSQGLVLRGIKHRVPEIIRLDWVIEMIKNHRDSLNLLKLAGMYFSCCSQDENQLSDGQKLDLIGSLVSSVRQPSSTIRRLALLILNLTLGNLNSDTEENAFALCSKAESVVLTVQSYRDRLMYLRKLTHEFALKSLPQDSNRNELILIPLSYLLGQLFVNFTLLWNPVMEILETYARGMDKNQFWDFFFQVLTSATDSAKKVLFENGDSEEIELDSSESAVDSLKKYFEEIVSPRLNETGNQRVDFPNFRLQLWRFLLRVADLAREKTKILSPLLLSLAREEFEKVDKSASSSQNLMLANIEESHMDKQWQKTTRPIVKRALLAALKVFAKFSGAKGHFQEQKLSQLYLDLLQNSDSSVQSAALNCIFTYKHKFLTPYRDNFERLVDDKTFRHELVLFTIDEQSSVVVEEHRAQLIPFLLRILYGKMYGKATGPGHQSEMRKFGVLNFVAGCGRSELVQFLDLLFSPICPHLQKEIPLREAILKLETTFQLQKSVPLKKLQGMMTNMGLVFKKLVPLLTDYLPIFFRICLCVGKMAEILQTQKQEIHPRFYSLVKSLKHAVFERITEFFSTFDEYKFESEELRALFEFLVVPNFGKLQSEGVYSPTGLLRLFSTWAESPRFTSLLNTALPYEMEELRWSCPIGGMFGLLGNERTQVSVREAVMNSVLTLLENEDMDPVVLTEEMQQTELSAEYEHANFGTRMVLRYLPELLGYMERMLKSHKVGKGHRANLKERDMKILAIISQFVKESKSSETLVFLILPFLESGTLRTEEAEARALTVVQHLVQNVNTSIELILRRLCPLFSKLTQRLSRLGLCSVLEVIGRKEQFWMDHLVTFAIDMNSWDRRRMEEPDYERRLDAHSRINKLLQGNQDQPRLIPELILCLIHQCSFTIEKVEDISLRDNASHSLQNLVKRLSAEWQREPENPDLAKDYIQTVVNKEILGIVKRGLGSKIEAVRHEFVALLGCLADSFPKFKKIAGLSTLRNSEDPEIDFFDNIRHIQLHRRARALNRLCFKLNEYFEDGAVEETENRLSCDSVSNFILPVALPFLFEPGYSKTTALAEETVKLMECVARMSSWKTYFSTLKYYLEKLQKEAENQKLLVRIVVSILNGFHFDLVLPVSQGDESQPTQIFHTVVNSLIPKLHKALTKKRTSEGRHKQAGRAAATRIYDEDEDLLRIPIALAMAKLLKELPQKLMERELPSILMKVCQLLKSRSRDVRQKTRKMLCSIVRCLGARYLPYVIKEMRGILLRGYQNHVLTFTTHFLLSEVQEELNAEVIAACLDDIVQVCNEELFGAVAEEKEVEEIRKNLMEAKSNKTYETYRILGQFVPPDCLGRVVNPLRQVLDTKFSHKDMQKVSEALKHFAQGLATNKTMTEEGLLIFCHQILTENLPTLFSRKRKLDLEMFEKSETEKPTDPKKSFRPESTFIIPQEPGRAGAKPKIPKASNIHILVEFALQVFHGGQKRKSETEDSEAESERLGRLDPFIQLFLDGIKSKIDKVITLSLRCLMWMLKLALPTLRNKITNIVDELFILLHQYARIGTAAKGETAELLVVLFKTVTAVIRDVSYYTVSEKQLELLLCYVEQDISDSHKQAAAFTLLKAILGRKLEAEGLQRIIRKIRELSITSLTEHVRVQARQVMLMYLLGYPAKRNPRKHLEFYLMQLSYEFEDGRISALEMLDLFFLKLPSETIREYAAMCFVHLVMRLVNEESEKCRKLVSLALRQFLERLEKNQREQMLQYVLDWLQSDKEEHQRLASLALVIFAEVEKEGFEKSLERFLGIFAEKLNSDSVGDQVEMDASDLKLAGKDKIVSALLDTVFRLYQLCPNAVRASNLLEFNNGIWESVEVLLRHPCVSVQFAAAQLCGQLLSEFRVEEFGQVSSKFSTGEYLLQNPEKSVRRLADGCFWQLRGPDVTEELVDQIVKNVLFLARVVRELSKKGKNAQSEESPDGSPISKEEREEEDTYCSLEWMAYQFSRACKWEVAKNSKSHIKRSGAFKWCAALSLECPPEEVSSFLPPLLSHINRELNVQEAKESLLTLAGEVCALLKSRLGVEAFSRELASCQKKANEKKISRKQQKAAEIVANPEKAARRKIKRHLAKKEAKQKRIMLEKPYKAKRRRIEQEEMIIDLTQ